jgi:phospholipid/cholesterol/gamma-HCH transport system substrate-binding protein
MEIALGPGKEYLKSGDTVLTSDNPGTLADITQKVQPVVDQVKVTLGTMDSVMKNLNGIVDPATKNNLQSTVAYMNRAMASLVVSSAQLQQLLNTQSGALAKSLNNVNSFTSNLASNNGKLNNMLTNFETTSSNLTKADIQGTMTQLQGTVARLNASVEKLDSKEGSIGLLLNDKQLYNNITNTTRSVNTLLDDIRVNPKRYLTIGVSLFGAKSKAQPLMAPLPVTDTATARLGTQ